MFNIELQCIGISFPEPLLLAQHPQFFPSFSSAGTDSALLLFSPIAIGRLEPLLKRTVK
jgi:hypothetical protein